MKTPSSRIFLSIAILLALLVLPGGAIATPSFAADGDEYLALGDSVAFGENPLVSAADRANAANFVGYPEVVARTLGLRLTNAACSGEASGGFISPTGTDNVCRPYRARFPLKADYKSSQLDFAVEFLRTHPNTRLVTITIGANDLFVLQKSCGGSVDCITRELPGLLNTLADNLNTIYTRLRLDAQYTGHLIALTYYLTNYNDPTAVAVFEALNLRVAEVTGGNGGAVAEGFIAFQDASAGAQGNACAAGLLIRLPRAELACDIHPSPAGRDLLALTVVQMEQQLNTVLPLGR